MSNVIVPGTVAAEPGSMTRAILDVFEALLDPAIFAASEVGLARISNAVAAGVCANIVASLDDTRYLQVNGGVIVGGDGSTPGGAGSMSRVQDAPSRGSVNTLIYRFTDPPVETIGTDITFTDDPALGSYWTINTSGFYAVSASVWSTSNAQQAIKVASALNNTFNVASELRIAGRFNTGVTPVPMTWIGYIAAGDLVWIATSVAANATTPSPFNNVTITRV